MPQTYYDSTLYFIDPSYPDIEPLTVKTKSLTKLIENLDIIDFQDSVQVIAKMSEKERDGVIQSLINKVIEEEKRLEEEQRMAQMNSAMFKQQQRDPRNRNLAAGGKWYFYNPTALSFGQTEFVKLWGRRKLEDNWRRKNKQVLDFGDDTEELVEGDSIPGQKPRPTDPKSKEYYMVDLPLTDSLMAISHQKIIDAFFAVGEIYQNELNDNKLAIENFEELNKRYPNNDYLLFSYYNLYKINDKIGQQVKASEYKSKIINGYPDSKYAKMFTNPNYLKELNEQKEAVTILYTETYHDFERHDYSRVITKAKNAEAIYPDNELIPKFKYMKAMSYGESGMLDQFVDALSDIVKNYPESEVKPLAKEMLLLLKDKGDVELPEEDLALVEEKKEEEKVEVPAEEIYKMDEKKTHYYVVVVGNKTKNVNRMKYNISNFDIEFFSMITFNVSSIILNDNYQVITVKSMDNKDKAMEYYKTIKANKDVYADFTDADYTDFVISSDNFAVFFKDQNIEKYVGYFQKHYLAEKEK